MMSYLGQPNEKKPDLSAKVQPQYNDILDSSCRTWSKIAAFQPYRERWCNLPLDQVSDQAQVTNTCSSTALSKRIVLFIVIQW
jgi:hypothetical protein